MFNVVLLASLDFKGFKLNYAWKWPALLPRLNKRWSGMEFQVKCAPETSGKISFDFCRFDSWWTRCLCLINYYCIREVMPKKGILKNRISAKLKLSKFSIQDFWRVVALLEMVIILRAIILQNITYTSTEYVTSLVVSQKVTKQKKAEICIKNKN